jgi:hypothetical protein
MAQMVQHVVSIGGPDREPLVSGARFDPYTGKKLDSVRPTYTHASRTHAHTPTPCPPAVCMQYHSTRFISNCIHTPAKQARPAHALRTIDRVPTHVRHSPSHWRTVSPMLPEPLADCLVNAH